MAFDLNISTGSSVPIYRQIVDQVRCAVAAGALAVGDRLPSVRALAERLLVNHNTVAKAYNALILDGLIESRHGQGVFVARRRSIYTRAERLRRLDAALDGFLSEVIALDFSAEEIQAAFARKFAESLSPGARSHD